MAGADSWWVWNLRRPNALMRSAEGAGGALVGDLEVDDVVADGVVDTVARAAHGDGVLLPLDGEQGAAEGIGEADAALVRGGGIARDGVGEGVMQAGDVLRLRVGEPGVARHCLTAVADTLDALTRLQ